MLILSLEKGINVNFNYSTSMALHSAWISLYAGAVSVNPESGAPDIKI